MSREKDLREAMPELARLGALLIVHAEVPGPIEACCQTQSAAASTDRTKLFCVRGRAKRKTKRWRLMIRLCRETGCRVHIVHHSSADALADAAPGEKLRACRSRPRLARIICTLRPKIFPMARLNSNVARRFANAKTANNSGRLCATARIDLVVSDHSPCPPDMKLREQGDFMNAWGGISSLQLRLPIMWTEASARGFRLKTWFDGYARTRAAGWPRYS